MEAQLHCCFVKSCCLNPEWLHQVQCEVEMASESSRLMDPQQFESYTGTNFKYYRFSPLQLWMKNQKWDGGVLEDHCLPSWLLVDLAKEICSDHYLFHFSSGGRCSVDCNGLVWETQLQPFWLWWLYYMGHLRVSENFQVPVFSSWERCS